MFNDKLPSVMNGCKNCYSTYATPSYVLVGMAELKLTNSCPGPGRGAGRGAGRGRRRGRGRGRERVK